MEAERPAVRRGGRSEAPAQALHPSSFQIPCCQPQRTCSMVPPCSAAQQLQHSMPSSQAHMFSAHSRGAAPLAAQGGHAEKKRSDSTKARSQLIAAGGGGRRARDLRSGWERRVRASVESDFGSDIWAHIGHAGAGAAPAGPARPPSRRTPHATAHMQCVTIDGLMRRAAAYNCRNIRGDPQAHLVRRSRVQCYLAACSRAMWVL